MPPKPRLHKTTANNTAKNPKPTLTSDHSEPQSADLTSEVEQQFEVELYWCIQQLQSGLKSGKLNQKQIQDHSKALTTLTSNAAPMIKKRQVMRLSFGDYRAKMHEEEKKQKAKALKITVNPVKTKSKSVFVKKSHFPLLSSENDFRFNFKATEEDKSESQQYETVSDEIKSKNFHFTPSKNEFRFNFEEPLSEVSVNS